MQAARVSRVGRWARVPVAVFALGIVGLVGAPAALAAPVPPKSVDPAPSCYFDNGNGTVTVNVNVTNSNAAAVTINYGPENKIEPGADNQGQPTTFAPGTTTNAWSGTFTTAQFATVKWHLNGNKVDLATTTVCASSAVPAQGNVLAVVVFGAVTTLIGGALLGERRRRGRLQAELG
jgi:hypothetical protein